MAVGGSGQRELQQVARSYHWIATELLSESATENWDAKDYGRKLMRWAKRIDGPPTLLDAIKPTHLVETIDASSILLAPHYKLPSSIRKIIRLSTFSAEIDQTDTESRAPR